MGLFNQSSNPVMSEKTFSQSVERTHTGVMSLKGTVQKTAILLLIVVACGLVSWNEYLSKGAANIYMLGGAIGGFVLAIVTMFKKEWAMYTAPMYAVCEGLFLGAFSAYASTLLAGLENEVAEMNAKLPMQAVALTLVTFLVMLGLYTFRIIKVTEKFKSIIIGLTLAVFTFYIISFIASFFGIESFHYMSNTGLISIGFSFFVVGLAALNLLLDFDLIEKGVNAQAPKFMEWYASFALLVTLVWIYYEILRLLVKLSSRD